MTSLFDRLSEKIALTDRDATLSDVYFDRDTGHITFLEIRVGNGLQHADFLVSDRPLTPPRAPGRSWQLPVDPQDLETAPKSASGGLLDTLSIEAWPPLIQGPFGNTSSPLLEYARLSAKAGVSDLGDPNADVDTGPLYAASQWRDMPVFGRDGELGTLIDMGFDPETQTIRQITFENRNGLFELPFAQIRYRAAPDGHIVTNATRVDWPSAQIA